MLFELQPVVTIVLSLQGLLVCPIIPIKLHKHHSFGRGVVHLCTPPDWLPTARCQVAAHFQQSCGPRTNRPICACKHKLSRTGALEQPKSVAYTFINVFVQLRALFPWLYMRWGQTSTFVGLQAPHLKGGPWYRYPQNIAMPSSHDDTGEAPAASAKPSFRTPSARNASDMPRMLSQGSPVRFTIDSGFLSLLSTPVSASNASLLHTASPCQSVGHKWWAGVPKSWQHAAKLNQHIPQI